ncbi:DUF2891 domain-containing protein [Maribacter algarum]|uniref:DUF2891 domain-containing protein n=1 Tax=Maribacter algarum (ex Zhang et al. 2020) TaxID=2578118 RepID=A0A5S3PR70_9FLAO|nr:DUF2891 domain-containing protein [Maribacter algarum]TMM57119.1 DUF2891 domain-containing protein [Maribacter algarum]
MRYSTFILFFILTILLGCKDVVKVEPILLETHNAPKLTFTEANRLAKLPLECISIEYPNKLNQSLNDASFIGEPKELHPAFYGCYDWHSAVHGHWSLVSLLKQFPSLNQAAAIRQKLVTSLSEKNILAEVAYFKIPGNASYERTYGWAWILKLAEELHTWNDPLARDLEKNLQPLTDLMAQSYLDFLPKLNYPIRVGEHSNTAFGLSFALDYAETLKDEDLKAEIEKTVKRFYSNDNTMVGCPLEWEPSGFDFLSPCLEEAYLVSRIYAQIEFKVWFDTFLPQLTNPEFKLVPGKILDRTDGKLVHLDGLNFSRAWCLYGIAEALPEYTHIKEIAKEHIEYSLPNIVDDNYGGTHWLGSFAIYALNKAE